MKAVIVAHRSPPELILAERDEPVPGAREALITVEAFALNPGELKTLDAAEDGAGIGWDFVGRVLRPAADGAGPDEGTLVVGTARTGAWAERIAQPVAMLAPVPDGIEPEQAVCLPVPGITAYLALRFGGLLVGKRVLVTGAAGAAGQYACQLALASGAEVAAAVRRDAQAAVVRSHGVEDVRVTDGVAAFDGDRFDLIVDIVGAGVAERVPDLIAERGAYVLFSGAGGDRLCFPIAPMLLANASFHPFDLFGEIVRGPDTGAEILARLLGALAQGTITVPFEDVHSWRDVDAVARRYLDADRRDKPVLRIDG